jgi:hypothetical protein
MMSNGLTSAGSESYVNRLASAGSESYVNTLWQQQLEVLLVEETRVPGENHDLPQVTDKLDHILL